MSKTIIGIILVAATGFGVAYSADARQDQEEKIQKDTTPFMQRKLDHSRDIVSGLAQENFPLITKRAQDLMLLSHETDWKVMTTPEYLRMSADFRGSAGRLRDSADAKNIDGATLAFFEVTLSCVRCHKYIRNANSATEQEK